MGLNAAVQLVLCREMQWVLCGVLSSTPLQNNEGLLVQCGPAFFFSTGGGDLGFSKYHCHGGGKWSKRLPGRRRASTRPNLRGFYVLVKRHYAVSVHATLSVLQDDSLPAQCCWCI